MACPANSRETKIGMGFVAQTDLKTPNTALEIWSLTITNTAPFTVTPTTEDDANDIGKGDEFPTQIFPVSMDVTGRIEKFMSSQAAAWAFAFGLGGVTETAAGTGAKYVCKPTDPAVDCIDLPPFTVVEQIRPGVDSFKDAAYVGCVVTGFTISLESGPGRNNARLTVDIAGTGQTQIPSGLAIPAPFPEDFLNAASATINVNGMDYVLAKSFISAEITWGVNPRLDTGYYPGSGVDAYGYALRGRMEYATRVAGMTFVARAQKGSPEYNQLLSRTEGTTIVTLTGATIGAGPDKNSIEIKFPRSVISAAVNGDADGLVTINCTVKPLKHTTLGYVEFTATTTKPGINPATFHSPHAEDAPAGEGQRVAA
jgi:Phage tail tube protein